MYELPVDRGLQNSKKVGDLSRGSRQKVYNAFKELSVANHLALWTC